MSSTSFIISQVKKKADPFAAVLGLLEMKDTHDIEGEQKNEEMEK